jgi:hypothetical protein
MNKAELENKESTELEWYLRLNWLKNENYTIEGYT